MSSEKTPNLKLHKWGPDDFTQMQEANENFVKLDEIIAETTEALSSSGAEVAEVKSKLTDVATQLEETAKYVLLRNFVVQGETDYTQTFARAIKNAVENKKSLFIEDGNYTISDTVKVNWLNPPNENGFEIIGQSKNVKIFCNFIDKYAFELVPNRIVVKNLSIYDASPTQSFKYSGFEVKGSLCLIDNVFIKNTNNAIKFTNAWCSNALNMSISYTNKGIIFAGSSGGCSISFNILSGSAGYTNTQPNGSVAIDFGSDTTDAQYNTILPSGQLDSFHYIFKVRSKAYQKVNEIYMEHNLELFTPDSIEGLIDLSKVHNYLFNQYVVSPVITIGKYGINKGHLFNPQKDTAIPMNNLLSYYLFRRGKLEKDELVKCDISNINKVNASDSTNLFGESSQIKSKADWLSPEIVLPVKPTQLSMVFSFRQSESNAIDTNLRLFEIGDTMNSKLVITKADMIAISNLVSNQKLFGEINERDVKYNNCVGVTIDFSTGEVRIYSPTNSPKKMTMDLTGISPSGNYVIDFMRAGANTIGVTMNYLAIFKGILEYEQFLNIYKETKPLYLNPTLL